MLRLANSSPKQLEFSLVIVGYFKILEIEIATKVFDSFKTTLTQKERMTTTSFQDEFCRQINSFSAFLKEDRPMSLAEMLMTLRHLAHVPADPNGDVYSKLKIFMRRSFSRPYYFYGKQKLGQRLQSSVGEFRNPAVHQQTFTKQQFDDFARVFLGSEERLGLLNLALKCLLQREDEGGRDVFK